MGHKERSRLQSLVFLAVALLGTVTLAAANIRLNTAPLQAQSSGIVQGMMASSPVLNYQGRLVDPTTDNPRNGTFLMTFRLYDAATGGSILWTEARNVLVTNGLFNTLLGDITTLNLAIFDGRDLWLGVQAGADLEATPRMPVAYVPYAIYATDAGKLGGQPPNAYATNVHRHDAEDIAAGTLPTDRYSAYSDLRAEGYLSNAASGLAQNNGAVQATLNADLLDGQHAGSFAAASHTHDAGALASGTLSTDRYSAISDLGAEGYLANAAGDLAQNNGVVQATLNADLLDGQHASALANVKFFTLELFSAFLANGAGYSTGFGPNAGMRLPDAGTPNFSYSFTIPPDYTPGTALNVRLIWHTPSASCGIELAGNYIAVARAGRTHIVGPATDTGIVMVGGTLLSAPPTANQSSAKDVSITTPVIGTNLQPGDVIIFSLYRSAGRGTDTCTGDLVIQGLSVTYQ